MKAKLEILSSPNFTENHVKFLRSERLDWVRDPNATAAENLVEFAGRLCYLSFGQGRQAPGSNADYIKKLIRMGHESVLEHASWTFLISGVSRSFTHQLVRHRVGFSYSQLSQQYHDESDAEFIEPPGLDDNSREIWFNAISQLKDVYKTLISSKKYKNLSSREDLRLRRSIARSILPNATKTSVVVTANARALRHFLDMRGAIVGDIEMRMVSQILLLNLKKEAPALFSDFEETEAPDGWPIVKRIPGAD